MVTTKATYLLTQKCLWLISNGRSLSVDYLDVHVYIVNAAHAQPTVLLTDKSQHATTALGSNCHSNIAIQPVTSSNAGR